MCLCDKHLTPRPGKHLHTSLRAPCKTEATQLTHTSNSTQCLDCYGFKHSTHFYGDILISWCGMCHTRHSHDLASCLPCSYKPSQLPDTCPVGSLCSPASLGQISSFPVWPLQLWLLPEMLMFQEHPPPGWPCMALCYGFGYLHLGPFWLPITASPSRLLGTLAGSEALWAL